MVSIVYSFTWGNLLANSVAEYHFSCAGSSPILATWNKGMEFFLVWRMRRAIMVSQRRGSWTSGWMSLGSTICKSFYSNNGAWYRWSRSILKTGCKIRHARMSIWKMFSPIFLRIRYGPYCKGFKFLYGPVKRSFRCIQAWFPIWKEWGMWCLSYWDFDFSLAHCNISYACF